MSRYEDQCCMAPNEFKFLKVRDVKSPRRGTEESAGIDFYIPNDFHGRVNLILKPGEAVNIPSGLKVSLPGGTVLVMMNKSGIALRKHLQVGACVVDEDYQGEVHLHVVNVGSFDVSVGPGEKLVQGLILPVLRPVIREVFPETGLYGDRVTERGTGGFGSTGND